MGTAMKIVFGGDVFLRIKDNGNPFAKIEDVLKDADLFLFTLETVLLKNGEECVPERVKSVYLCAKEDNLKYLKGLNAVVSINNNHIFDCGRAGYQRTRDLLDENSIISIPVDKEKVIEVNGKKILLFSLSAYRNSLQAGLIDPKALKKIIDRHMPDITIAIVHWGFEHSFLPSPEQVKYARNLIDCGVDIVAGSHPHAVQGTEKYKKGVIFYSLGNLNMWQMDVKPSISSRLGMLAELDTKTEELKLHPVFINNNYQPELLSGQAKIEALKFMEQLPSNITQFQFMRHVSRRFLYTNIYGGWIPRIKKSPKEIRLFLGWLADKFTIASFLFLPLSLISDKTDNKFTAFKKVIEKQIL